jgi:subtilisin family serine protease
MRWLVTYRVAADGGSSADDQTPQPEPSAAAAAPASDAASVAPAAAAARLRAQDGAKYRVLAPDGPAAAAGARLVQHYSHLPVSAVELPDAAALAALRAHPDVARVEPDRPNVLALQQSLPLINQPAAAAAGDAGAGCFVAVVDGVVDVTHPDLGSCATPGAPPPCRVALAKDFSSNGSSGPAADTSHGTNVASIVARTAPGSLILALVRAPAGCG